MQDSRGGKHRPLPCAPQQAATCATGCDSVEVEPALTGLFKHSQGQVMYNLPYLYEAQKDDPGLKEQLHPGFCIEVRDRVAFENARKLTEHFGSASVGQPDAPISFADQGQQLCSQVLGQQSPVYPAVPDGAALLTPQRQRFDAAQAAKLTAALDHERKLQGINPVLEHLARRHLQRQQAGRCTVTPESPVVMLGRVSIMVPGHLSNMSDNEVQALLDQLLCWLWCVHDIDYYAGKELALLADLQDRADVGRTLRPDAEDAAGCCAVAGAVLPEAMPYDGLWQHRIKTDAYAASQQKIQAKLRVWLEPQVYANRWPYGFTSSLLEQHGEKLRVFKSEEEVMQELLAHPTQQVKQQTQQIVDQLYKEAFCARRLRDYLKFLQQDQHDKAAQLAQAAAQAAACSATAFGIAMP